MATLLSSSRERFASNTNWEPFSLRKTIKAVVGGEGRVKSKTKRAKIQILRELSHLGEEKSNHWKKQSLSNLQSKTS